MRVINFKVIQKSLSLEPISFKYKFLNSFKNFLAVDFYILLFIFISCLDFSLVRGARDFGSNETSMSSNSTS